jgi:hypothetical protein
LREVLHRERVRLTAAETVIAAHWRHAVDDYPMSGDQANEIIADTPDLHCIGGYRDPDVVIDVFATGAATSVAAHEGVPGATWTR